MVTDLLRHPLTVFTISFVVLWLATTTGAFLRGKQGFEVPKISVRISALSWRRV